MSKCIEETAQSEMETRSEIEIETKIKIKAIAPPINPMRIIRDFACFACSGDG